MATGKTSRHLKRQEVMKSMVQAQRAPHWLDDPRPIAPITLSLVSSVSTAPGTLPPPRGEQQFSEVGPHKAWHRG